MILSFLVVARRTDLTTKRRYSSPPSPMIVMTPAIVPGMTAMRWYTCSGTPAASVKDLGTPRPMTWPAATNRMPKWNRGEAQRRIRDSCHCEDRLVQPNWSVR